VKATLSPESSTKHLGGQNYTRDPAGEGARHPKLRCQSVGVAIWCREIGASSTGRFQQQQTFWLYDYRSDSNVMMTSSVTTRSRTNLFIYTWNEYKSNFIPIPLTVNHYTLCPKKRPPVVFQITIKS